jgi:hypothetical protein
MAKGIELPVNVLVIIVIAVLVLLALGAVLAMGTSALAPIQVLFTRTNACSQYACGQITADQVDVNINFGNDAAGTPFARTLLGMCMYEKKCPSGESDVKKYCGCPT